LTELEALSQLHKIDVIAVTEVQAQNPDLLKINNYSKFIKPPPHDHPLGKKGGGILLFVGNYPFPKLIQTPNISDNYEIFWVSVRPKAFPHPFNMIVFLLPLLFPKSKRSKKDSCFSCNYIAVPTLSSVNSQTPVFS